jgi:hypothetical protein
MVSIAHEYVAGQADDIYVYAMDVSGVVYFDVFYRVNGSIYEKHTINKSSPKNPIDTAIAVQQQVIDIGIAAIRTLETEATRLGNPMPTEMKLHYSVGTGALDATLRYDPFYTDDSPENPDAAYEAWLGSLS